MKKNRLLFLYLPLLLAFNISAQPCVTNIAPWLDNLESYGTNSNIPASTCWTSTSSNNFNWLTRTAGTPSTGTGPTEAYSGTNYFYTEASGANQGDIATLVSPDIDVSSLNNPTVQFHYHMHGSDIQILYIDLFSGGVWNTIDSIVGEQHPNQADLWTEKIINITGATGIVQVGFRVVRGGGLSGDVAIDEIKIQEACGAAFIAPWLDNVESYSSNNNIPASTCWTSTSSTNFNWLIRAGSTPSASTGPTGSYSGTNYFYTEASNGNAGDTATIISPSIDISNLSSPTVQFYYHMYGDDIQVLYVDLFSNGVWTTIDAILGEQQPNQTDGWLAKSIDITGAIGVVQVRFRAVRGTGFNGDIAIDNIQISSCLRPTALSVDIMGTTVDLEWIENGSATNWQIEWGAEGFTQGNGTLILTGSNPYNLSGLNLATSYTIYVRSICGVGDTSLWSEPLNFNTACFVNTAPWLETIELYNTGNISTATCWTSTSSGNFNWLAQTGSTISSGTGPAGAYSGSKYFYTEASGANQGDVATLVSPKIDVSNLSNPEVHFYYHMYGNNIQTLYVDLFSGGVWTTIDSIVGQQHIDEDTPWLERIIDIGGITGIVQVQFRTLRGADLRGDIAIDDIRIKEGCTTLMAPWGDNVEVYRSNTGNNYNGIPASTCWTSTGLGDFNWLTRTGGTPSSGTGPTGAYNGSNYFYVEASGSNSGDIATLISPEIDISNLSNPEIQFYYHMHGSDIQALHVDLFSNGAWVTIDNILGQQQPNQSDPWLERVIDISGNTGTVQIRFRAVRGAGFNGDIAIDNVLLVNGTILPIELISFNAKVINDRTVDLLWKTASEINNDYFSVERSQNGLDWKTIEEMPGYQSSNVIQNYYETDNNPYTGTSYYRLKQVDLDGKYTYSRIVSIYIKPLHDDQISIYPNPTTDRITIESKENILEQFSIYNSLGEDVSSFCKLISKNNGRIELDVSDLGAGVYLFRTEFKTLFVRIQ